MHNLLLELDHDEANLIAMLMRNSDSDVKTAILNAVKVALNLKRGHWIVSGRTNIYGGKEVTCSECGDTMLIQHLELEHFCRNCGAKMI